VARAIRSRSDGDAVEVQVSAREMMTGRKIEDASRQPSRVGQARFPLGDLQQPAIAGKRQAPGGCGCVERENRHRDNDLR
jgi:hypothetical protein